MSVLERALREGRSHADSVFRPAVLKVMPWIFVLGWSSWIAVQWLRDASATSPPPVVAPPRPAIDLDAAIAQAAAAPVFGEAAPETILPAPAAPLDLKLKGVLAGGTGPMAAIVDTGRDEDEFVMLGQELRPGVVLEGVHPTHIVVGRDGASHRVELEAVRSESARPKAAARPGGTGPAHGRSAVTSAAAEEAPAPPAETEPAAPLAPPMPQSDASPRPLAWKA